MHPTISALSSQMTEHYWTPQSNVSNETSTNKTFQRTISAQVHTCLHSPVESVTIKPLDVFFFLIFCWVLSLCSRQTLQDTLAYATALLNEKEQSGSSNGSDGSPANDNANHSLRQVVLRFVHAGWLTQLVTSISKPRGPSSRCQKKNLEIVASHSL